MSSGWLRNDSVCLCLQRSSKFFVASRCNGVIYKDLIKKIVCNPESNKCIINQCESCPGTATLKEFLHQELSKHEDDQRLNYCQRDTADQAIFATITATEATTGINNTASYIPWLYTTWDQMVASNVIHFILVLMTTTITQAFCIKFKQCLFIILKLITHV